jgi:hypothetical protein
MRDFIETWLFDPAIGKFVAAVVGVLIVATITRFVNRSLSRFVKAGAGCRTDAQWFSFRSAHFSQSPIRSIAVKTWPQCWRRKFSDNSS